MKNSIKTTDIYLCAALLALGAKLEGVDKSDPRHMQFTVISNVPKFESPILADAVKDLAVLDLDYYENEWANGTLMINATYFKDAIQRMKSVIHSH